jgi:hypothetical protein
MVKLPSIIFFEYYHILSTHVICSFLYDKLFLVFIYKITLSKVGLRADDDREAVAKVIELTRL